MIPVSKKKEVFMLRKSGYSYSYIASKTGISKSTLSGWLAQVPYTANKETILNIGKARAASGEKKARMKQQSIEEAKQEAIGEIGSVAERDIFMLGLGVYIGEGSKTHDIVSIANSDPRVLRLALLWFRALGVPK